MKTEDIAKNLLEGKTCDECSEYYSGCRNDEDNTCKSWSQRLKIKMTTQKIKTKAKTLNIKWTCDTETEAVFTEEDIRYINDQMMKKNGS
jgi:glutaminase